MRESRTLRATWRGLETWHGIGLNRRASPRPYRWAECGNGAMAEPVRHRQTKGAATDMFDLPPPRHTSTLPRADVLLAVQAPLWSAASACPPSSRRSFFPSRCMIRFCVACQPILSRERVASIPPTRRRFGSALATSSRPLFPPDGCRVSNQQLPELGYLDVRRRTP